MYFVTVEELITALQKVENKKAMVVLAADPEGNDFSPLARHAPDMLFLQARVKTIEAISLWPQY